MAYVVRMPKLGVEMETGVVLAWHVEEGDEIEEEELIAEIESEKAQAEITARESGVIRRILMQVDEKGPPGAAMGIVAGSDEDIGDLRAEAGIEAGTESQSTSDAEHSYENGSDELSPEEDVSTEEEVDTGAAADVSFDTRATTQSRKSKVRVSPRARKRAEQLGVDLMGIEASGPQDSIIEADIEREANLDAKPGAVSDGENMSASSQIPDEPTISEKTLTLTEERTQSRMRKTIAERLSNSWREAPHVTVDREVGAEPLFSVIEAADASGYDISITDVLLRAISETLSEHPEFNAHFKEGVHRIYDEHNIGIAIDIEYGLVAPVLPDLRSKSVREIYSIRKELTERVLSGEYTNDDLSNSTFTISNLGSFGVDSFTPIINPPEVAILGINSVNEKVVRGERDQMNFRRYIGFSLSFDHRVVDGADAARFLDTLAEQIKML